MDSIYIREYSIYAIRWKELSELIKTYYRKRLQVLEKNGVQEPARPVAEVDTFMTKKLSEFRSASLEPAKLKEQKERKLFDSIYQTFKTVALSIQDSLGKDFIYHEDDIQKDYKAHSFYYGLGIRSIDVQDKWLVPIFSGDIRKDSLYVQIATYANPRLNDWEKRNGFSHEATIEVALSDLRWNDLRQLARTFLARRLEILR